MFKEEKSSKFKVLTKIFQLLHSPRRSRSTSPQRRGRTATRTKRYWKYSSPLFLTVLSISLYFNFSFICLIIKRVFLHLVSFLAKKVLDLDALNPLKVINYSCLWWRSLITQKFTAWPYLEPKLDYLTSFAVSPSSFNRKTYSHVCNTNCCMIFKIFDRETT